LTIVGTLFEADEGARMRIAVATEQGNRVGIAEATITGGAFTLSIPQVLNDSWYVGITLYVDRNDDDTCEPDEHFWGFTTRAVASDIHFEVTPDELCSSTFGTCSPRHQADQPCSIGSGDTVLTKPVPCTP
jgi:hypothetical protein